jgi:hypothetical protein
MAMDSVAVKSNVLTVNQLSEDALKKLFNNEICILRIKAFCENSVCDKLATWFISSEELTEYPYIMQQEGGVKSFYYGVDRVGVPYNSTYGKPQQKEKYYQEALSGIRALRAASHPELSPIDRVRVELDENWPLGANLANFEGKKMFIGIGRLMQWETSHLTELQPHCDSVPNDYANLLGQFSANIYLSVPSKGGELEIWDVAPLATNVIHKSDPNRDWRAELPESIIVKPEKGDLLMFNTRRPHAIRRFYEGIRVAAQCFIGINFVKR